MEVREIVDERRKQRAEPVVVVQKGSTPHQPNRGAWIRETETGDATVAQVASSPLVTVTAQPKPKPKPGAQPAGNTQSQSTAHPERFAQPSQPRQQRSRSQSRGPNDLGGKGKGQQRQRSVSRPRFGSAYQTANNAYLDGACFICGELGHYANECRSPRLCYACKQRA